MARYCFLLFLLLLHWSQSYILLTADLEDFQNLAQQVTSPEIMGHFSKLWRRASNEFRAKISEKQQSESLESHEAPSRPNKHYWDARRRVISDDLIEMAKNVSRRLNTFKQFVEGIANL